MAASVPDPPSMTPRGWEADGSRSSRQLKIERRQSCHARGISKLRRYGVSYENGYVMSRQGVAIYRLERKLVRESLYAGCLMRGLACVVGMDGCTALVRAY